jgi:hypothetical protein
MVDYPGIDGVFFLTIATISVGFFGLVIRYCLKSKCKHCSLCFGLITIERDTHTERIELHDQLEHGVPMSPTPPTTPHPKRSSPMMGFVA